MAKQETRIEMNTFVKGLITEASPLTFPPNASQEEYNFVLNRDGSRNRRYGIDIENPGFYKTTQLATGYNRKDVNTFLWKNVGGISGKNVLVVRVRTEMYFFDPVTKAYINKLSNGLWAGAFSTTDYPKGTLASVDGKLVFAYGGSQFSVITANSTITAFTETVLSWKVRDFWGVESEGQEETDTDYRPTTLTEKHTYNLMNQSWGVPRKDKTGTLVSPIALFNTDLHVYPSNREKVWSGLQYQPVAAGADPFERIYTNLFDDRRAVAGVVSKGYFIIDFINRGVSRRTTANDNSSKYGGLLPTLTVSALPQDFSTKGADICAEYSGRVFFAGFGGDSYLGDKRSPVINNFVLFSQLVKNVNDIGKCYQEGDPTSRESNDLVDTDGGYIRIIGANTITALYPVGNVLLVLADNGVWSISGGNNYGFTATNYKVTKISSLGCISPRGVITDGANVLFCSREGLVQVSKNQIGDFEAADITQLTVQSWYNALSNNQKITSVAEYDYLNNKVRFIFSDIQSGTIPVQELVLDNLLSAFYPNQINPVGTNLIDIVGIYRNEVYKIGDRYETLKYICINISSDNYIQIGVASYSNMNFRDWATIDGYGTDAYAYMITGALTASDTSVKKNTPYIVVHFERTEDGSDAEGVPLLQSSCPMQVRWGWSNGAVSNQWGRVFEAYRNNRVKFNTPYGISETGYDVVSTKNKLRGNGKAVNFYFGTSPYKDCKILGWSLTIQGNAIT